MWEEFDKVNASTHASSIAYYSFLPLVPLLALFLFWMYLVFFILIACGFLTRYLQEESTKGETPA